MKSSKVAGANPKSSVVFGDTDYCKKFHRDRKKCENAGCVYQKNGICRLPSVGALRREMEYRQGFFRPLQRYAKKRYQEKVDAATRLQRAYRNRPVLISNAPLGSPLLVSSDESSSDVSYESPLAPVPSDESGSDVSYESPRHLGQLTQEQTELLDRIRRGIQNTSPTEQSIGSIKRQLGTPSQRQALVEAYQANPVFVRTPDSSVHSLASPISTTSLLPSPDSATLPMIPSTKSYASTDSDGVWRLQLSPDESLLDTSSSLDSDFSLGSPGSAKMNPDEMFKLWNEIQRQGDDIPTPASVSVDRHPLPSAE